MSQTQSDFPQLSYMFGCYFHQDWDLEGDDWPDLVRSFAQDPSANAGVAAAEIDRLLLKYSDDSKLRDMLFMVFHCNYDPRPVLGGPTMREWLRSVCELLRKQPSCE